MSKKKWKEQSALAAGEKAPVGGGGESEEERAAEAVGSPCFHTNTCHDGVPARITQLEGGWVGGWRWECEEGWEACLGVGNGWCGEGWGLCW